MEKSHKSLVARLTRSGAAFKFEKDMEEYVPSLTDHCSCTTVKNSIRHDYGQESMAGLEDVRMTSHSYIYWMNVSSCLLNHIYWPAVRF